MPTIENRWTTGNLLSLIGIGFTAALILFGGGAALSELKAGVTANGVAITSLTTELVMMRVDIAARETRVRAIEVQIKGNYTEQNALRRDVDELRVENSRK